MFKGFFGGATEEKLPQLAADTQQQDAEGNREEVSRVEIKIDEVLQAEATIKRPPDFLDNIYPPIPEPREFSTDEVWERSSVSDDEQENVERAQQLLGGLPQDTSDAVKRQIVEAAFKAFEVSISDIVSAATHEIRALRDYIDDANERAEKFKAVSEERIGELEAEIERIRGTIVDIDDEREQLIGSALEVIDDVEPVLFFFGEASTHTDPGIGRSDGVASLRAQPDQHDEDVPTPAVFDDPDTTVAVASQRDEEAQELNDPVEQIN